MLLEQGTASKNTKERGKVTGVYIHVYAGHVAMDLRSKYIFFIDDSARWVSFI